MLLYLLVSTTFHTEIYRALFLPATTSLDFLLWERDRRDASLYINLLPLLPTYGFLRSGLCVAIEISTWRGTSSPYVVGHCSLCCSAAKQSPVRGEYWVRNPGCVAQHNAIHAQWKIKISIDPRRHFVQLLFLQDACEPGFKKNLIVVAPYTHISPRGYNQRKKFHTDNQIWRSVAGVKAPLPRLVNIRCIRTLCCKESRSGTCISPVEWNIGFRERGDHRRRLSDF